MKTRQLKALETKQRIFETALHLFRLKGYDRVSVDEIVQASSTSKGAFYTHFKSKHEIFLEQFKQIDAFYLDFQENLPEDVSPIEALCNMVYAQMEFLRGQLGLDLVRTIYINALNPESERFLLRFDRTLYTVVRNLVERAQDAGELTADLSATEITMLITRCMRGTLYDWCILGENMELAREGEKYIRIMLNGLSERFAE